MLAYFGMIQFPCYKNDYNLYFSVKPTDAVVHNCTLIIKYFSVADIITLWLPKRYEHSRMGYAETTNTLRTRCYMYNSTNTKRWEKNLVKILTPTGFEPASQRLSRPGSLTNSPHILSTILTHHILFIRAVYPDFHLPLPCRESRGDAGSILSESVIFRDFF